MAVTLDADALGPYPRFSLYNSPYVAHERGCAVDLYPPLADTDPERSPGRPTGPAPSPVAGEVRDTRTVAAPSKAYATGEDHLILLDTGTHVARVLHVDPAVAAGDRVAVGDSLGTLVRSGFFAPWVANHVHLGFRDPDADPYRAAGSLPVDVAVPLRPVPWDGTGTVVETGDTYAVLDRPTHPDPGACYAGIDGGDCVLDGGLPHYDGGGALVATNPDSDGRCEGARPDGEASPVAGSRPVSLAGTRVGTATGRDVTWDAVTVYANDRPVTGLSLFCGRSADFGAKLVCPDRTFAVGETVTVDVRPAG